MRRITSGIYLRRAPGLIYRQVYLQQITKRVQALSALRAARLLQARRVILAIARKLSSGRLSYSDLIRQGHPYSRRHPSASRPEIISSHAGDPLRYRYTRPNSRDTFFRDSWDVQILGIKRFSADLLRGATQSQLTVVLSNKAPHALFIKLSQWGTRMVHRPVFETVMRRIPLIIRKSV